MIKGGRRNSLSTICSKLWHLWPFAQFTRKKCSQPTNESRLSRSLALLRACSAVWTAPPPRFYHCKRIDTRYKTLPSLLQSIAQQLVPMSCSIWAKRRSCHSPFCLVVTSPDCDVRSKPHTGTEWWGLAGCRLGGVASHKGASVMRATVCKQRPKGGKLPKARIDTLSHGGYTLANHVVLVCVGTRKAPVAAQTRRQAVKAIVSHAEHSS